MYPLLWISCLFFNWYQSSPIRQSPSTALTITDRPFEHKISEIGYKYLIDEEKQLTFDDALSEIDNFSIRRDNKGFTPTNRVLWTTLNIAYIGEQESKEIVLELAHAHLEEYDIYIMEGDSVIYHRHQGDMFPFQDREVKHNLFVHHLNLEKDILYDIFFRFDQHGIETLFPLKIFDLDTFNSSNTYDKILHGLIIGLCLITSFVTVILFFIFRQKFYLIEVGVAFFSIFYILAEEGYGYMFIWPNNPVFNGTSRPLAVGGLILCGLWFTLEFLKIRSTSRLKWSISVFTAISLLLYMVLVHPFNLSGLRTAETIGNDILTLMILCIVNGIVILWISLSSWLEERNKDGLVIFMVFLVTIALLAFRTLGIQGLVPISPIVQHTGFITRALHIPIIGMYLVYNALELINSSKNVQIKLLEEKAKANEALIEGVNQERQRIAMAIHDSAGSMLTGLTANLQSLYESIHSIGDSKYFAGAMDLVNKLNGELRNISNNLYPNTLQKLGLKEELKRLSHQIQDIHSINTHLEIQSPEGFTLKKDLELQLYYIIREILDNVAVHSEAKNVWVQYTEYPNEIYLLIEDDGKGFDYEQSIKKGRSGLVNLNYRMKVLDGSIDYYTMIDKGTSITLNIPIKS